jgi:hypothetical protein
MARVKVRTRHMATVNTFKAGTGIETLTYY